MRIIPSKNTVSSLVIPGSKSLSNRYLLLAATAKGVSKISGLLKSNDTDVCLSVLRTLGITIQESSEAMIIQGCDKNFPVKEAKLHLGQAGTVARFLPGLLAASENSGKYELTASEQLSKRPIAALLSALQTVGADIIGDRLPFEVKGSGIYGGEVFISGKETSQFFSGLMLSAPLWQNNSTIHLQDANLEEENYIQMTLNTMKNFGVSVETEGMTFKVSPQKYRAANLSVEADANTAGYFFALAALHGTTMNVPNLSLNSIQPGVKFLNVLERMGATVTAENGITVKGPTHLKGDFIIDMKPMAEMALTLGVMAAFADAPITMTNLAHIRHHESDRLAVLSENLSALGVNHMMKQDGIAIHPSPLKRYSPALIHTYDDHRVAMSFALFGTMAEGITIENPSCVSKTCPSFFDLLGKAGIQMENAL